MAAVVFVALVVALTRLGPCCHQAAFTWGEDA